MSRVFQLEKWLPEDARLGAYLVHFDVSEFLPEVIDGIETDDSHSKDTDPFDAVGH